jgi:predicted dehydrogenase
LALVARGRVRLGVIGGGMMSQIAHLPFFARDERCELAIVSESRPSLIKALRERYETACIVSDYRDVLDDAGVEAVVIVAPRQANAPLSLEALEAGKHVLVEKPMAHTTDQARRLVAAAETRAAIYAVGFMKRYDPGVQQAKAAFDDLLRTGRLGSLLLARFYDFATAYAVPPPPHTRPEESRSERFPEWPLWPDWLPERHHATYAWFVNVASHDVNLATYFFRTLDVVSANSPSDRAVTAVLEAHGAPVVLEIARTAAGRWLQGAEFLFEGGRLTVEIPSPMATDAVARVILDENVHGPARRVLEVAGAWSFAAQARGFIDCVVGLDRPLTSSEDGLRDLQLIESLWRACR